MSSLTGRVLPTLQKRADPLAATDTQRTRLDAAVAASGATFEATLDGAGLYPLRAMAWTSSRSTSDASATRRADTVTWTQVPIARR